LAYGQVQTSDGMLAAGALVRAWLLDADGNPSEPLSTLVDGYGYWMLSLLLPDCSGVQIRLQAIGRKGSEVELQQPACETRPAPMLVLPEKGRADLYLPLVVQ
jgi:hypothetical protein